jgi:hypothetical protein
MIIETFIDSGGTNVIYHGIYIPMMIINMIEYKLYVSTYR